MLYFLETPDAPYIRVGGSDSRDKRVRSQLAQGYKLLACRPGTWGGDGTDEDKIHKYFAAARIRPSTYDSDELWIYVAWLLEQGYATSLLDEWMYLPDMPFAAFGPSQVGTAAIEANGQATLLDALPVRQRVQWLSEQAHLMSVSDEWLTPPDVIELARLAMGSIDTDPASNHEANRWIKAQTWYDRKHSGLDLRHPWHGNVWLNPPYGRGEASASVFVARLVSELSAGAVQQAITCLNLNSSCSLWFEPIWRSASAHLIWRGRIAYIKPGNKGDSSPSKGTILSYFGADWQRFGRVFGDFGTVVRTTT